MRTARDMATALIICAIESGFTKFGTTPGGGGNPPSIATGTDVDVRLLVVVSGDILSGGHSWGRMFGVVQRKRHVR